MQNKGLMDSAALPGGCPCFGPGTLIATRDGDMPVEWIGAGHEVLTRDRGFQPVRWVGRFPVSSLHMAMREEFGNYVVEKDAFGPGCPDHPLILSRHHRVLIGGAAVETHFAASEAICPVGGLVDPGRVEAQPEREITYTHVLCDRHEIVMANALWVESLFSAEARDYSAPYPPEEIVHDRTARLCLTEEEGAMLTALEAVEQPQAQVSVA